MGTAVLSGVPQGSALGPLLFISYINDMPETLSSFIYMYADDTKVVREVTTTRDGKCYFPSVWTEIKS